MPRFYAEITLQATYNRKALEPTRIFYYYPDGIHGGFKGKPRKRTVVVTVSAKKLSGDTDALSAVIGVLKDVQPTNEVRAAPVSAGKWAVIVSNEDTAPTDLAADAQPVGMMPVNATVEVREVGDPSKILALIAEWTTTAKDPVDTVVEKAVDKNDKATPAGNKPK